MHKKAGVIILAVFLIIAIAFGIWYFTPENSAARFVDENSAAFAAHVDSGQPVAATWNGKEVQVWDGTHTMYAFTLGHGTGDVQYWGVYYSPDDVPLPFQNADIPLVPDGDGAWTWQAEGDNHGSTKKLADQWYYFEAAL